MCECCNGDCKLCGGYGHIRLPEPITKVYVRETVDCGGCQIDELIINDKYIMVEDNSLNPTYRYEMMETDKQKQQKELLESYQKISDTFDDFTKLMRSRVPYDQWPEHCKIAGVNPEMLGPIEEKPEPINFGKEICELSDKVGKELQEALKHGWKNVQPNNRPDESFRAMVLLMSKWMNFIRAKEQYAEHNNNIWDILKARGLDPTKAFPMAMIDRVQDIGRAQERLKSILDDEIFEKLSKHNPYWDSNHEPECEKLDDLRRKFAQMNDNLWDLWAILRAEGE